MAVDSLTRLPSGDKGLYPLVLTLSGGLRDCFDQQNPVHTALYLFPGNGLKCQIVSTFVSWIFPLGENQKFDHPEINILGGSPRPVIWRQCG